MDDTLVLFKLNQETAMKFMRIVRWATLFQHHSFSVNKRRFARCMALLLAIGALGNLRVAAQDYPQRPITVILPTAAGGTVDILTRLWANYAAKKLNQPIVVENRPGAGAVSAAQAVLSKPNDGYTVYSAGTSSLILNRFTGEKLPFDSQKDFVGVSMLANLSFLISVSNASNIKTISELQEAAKARPMALNFGSAGQGNVTHLLAELLSQKLGIKLTHIPYKGEIAALTALMSDEVQLVVPTLTTAGSFASAGRITGIAVIGPKRVSELPNAPTLNEAGVSGFQGGSWSALVARTGTPPEAIRKLHEVTQQFLMDPEVIAKLRKISLEPITGPVNIYPATLTRDLALWTEVTRPLDLRAR